MKAVLTKINHLIGNADPNNYSSISYSKYYRDLTAISNEVISNNEMLKIKILAISDEKLKLELLSYL